MELEVQEHIITIDVIKIKGRLEAVSVGDLRSQQEQLLAADKKNFVVDLIETEFMDSAGMAALVSLLKQARQKDGKVILVKPTNPAAYRILTLTRFDQVFTMVDTVNEGLSQF